MTSRHATLPTQAAQLLADQASRRTTRTLPEAGRSLRRDRRSCSVGTGALLGWWWSAGKPGRQLTIVDRSGVHGGSCGAFGGCRDRCDQP
jgi:hypothetical protein